MAVSCWRKVPTDVWLIIKKTPLRVQTQSLWARNNTRLRGVIRSDHTSSAQLIGPPPPPLLRLLLLVMDCSRWSNKTVYAQEEAQNMKKEFKLDRDHENKLEVTYGNESVSTVKGGVLIQTVWCRTGTVTLRLQTIPEWSVTILNRDKVRICSAVGAIVQDKSLQIWITSGMRRNRNVLVT